MSFLSNNQQFVQDPDEDKGTIYSSSILKLLSDLKSCKFDVNNCYCDVHASVESTLEFVHLDCSTPHRY